MQLLGGSNPERVERAPEMVFDRARCEHKGRRGVVYRGSVGEREDHAELVGCQVVEWAGFAVLGREAGELELVPRLTGPWFGAEATEGGEGAPGRRSGRPPCSEPT